MSLAKMSLCGAVLIMVVIGIRAVAINRLPKRTFIVLWSVVLIRLLVPFEIPCELSVYSLIGYSAGEIAAAEQAESGMMQRIVQGVQKNGIRSDEMTESGQTAISAGIQLKDNGESAQSSEMSDGDGIVPESKAADGTILTKLTSEISEMDSYAWTIVWGIGAILCTLFFAITYKRCLTEFRMSLPVSNEFVKEWLDRQRGSQDGKGASSKWDRLTVQRFRRPVTARVSSRIDAPLTYGIFQPVILLPGKTEWEETEQLEYVLWHEYMHIHYGDNVLKLIAVAGLCIHWFNPLVWAMYFLLNRDIELACDESVVRRCGIDYRSTYANVLINMEAKRSGLMPLCNNFSQNAIEERVCAIMKIRKISLGAVIFAAGLVVGVTTAFATSAASSGSADKALVLTGAVKDDAEETTEKAAMTEAQDTEFTKEEYNKLLALQFGGYENMTVSEFQSKVWALTDTAEYRDLLDRFSASEALYKKRDNDDTAYFMFNILEPLTAERWQRRDFSGYVSAGQADPPLDTMLDMAALEYVMTLTILDADRLTVGEYNNTRLSVAEGIGGIFAAGYAAEELADAEYMHEEIGSVVDALTAEFSTDTLRVEVEYGFKPIDPFYLEEVNLYKEYQEERRDGWQETLKPYIPFGLTCDYDAQADEGKMYFQGKEVRGIIDEELGVWITEHAGIGVGVFAEDAIEVYAVYENGQLAGLRAATAKEQEEWNQKRIKTTESGYDQEEEVREFLPATEADYRSMLSLQKPGYQQMSLEDFNMALLDWGNEHPDSYDRIMCDVGWDDYCVPLSDEEKEFVTCTVSLSGQENAMYVRSIHTGKEEEDVCLQGDLTKEPGGEEAAYVWCRMFYQFTYHISDKEKVTVGERDRCVGGMLKGIQQFWDQTDIEDILKMDKNDITKKLNELAKEHSTKAITITIKEEDQIGFECMDERSLMEERRLLEEESR